MSGAGEAFFRRGWVAFDEDAPLADWVRAAAPVARECAADPALRERWLRCGETWFAGVNVFPNRPDGGVPDRGVPPLRGRAVEFIVRELGLAGFAWDRAQISVCYPGYPAAPSEGESAAAFGFRLRRDAAHVDGLLRDAARRRSVGEVHGFILGIPLNPAPPGAAPLVVWEGSHEVMRAAFRRRLSSVAPEAWPGEDITEAYAAARREIFETCRRVPVHVPPGAAYLIHRLALHGVAPWPTGSAPGTSCRAIAYFRPDCFPGQPPGWWLDRP